MENINLVNLKKLMLIILIVFIFLNILSLIHQNIHPLDVYDPVVKIYTINNENPAIKKITYEAMIVNHSDKDIDFTLEFTRENNDWYPYIDLIPETYTTSELSITSNDNKKFFFTTIINSDDLRLINSFYTYAKVNCFVK